MDEGREPGGSDSGCAWLVAALQGLDRRLARALALACDADLAQLPSIPFQGLWIAEREIEQLLERPAAHSRLWSPPEAENAPWPGSPLARIVESFRLDDFDAACLLLALAPEVDRRYERIFSFLQEDVTCRRPAAGLALDLLCASPGERIARRASFVPEAPLISGRLLSLDSPELPLLARGLRLDPQVRSLLLDEDGLDERLLDWCELTEPWELPNALGGLPLAAAAFRAHHTKRPLHVVLTGPPSTAKRRTAAAVAAALELPLLSADLRRAPRDGLAVLTREAQVRDAVVFLEGLPDGALGGASSAPELLLVALETVDAAASGSGLGLVAVPVGAEPPERRRAVWSAGLDGVGALVGAGDLDLLATRFRLDTSQIEAAVAAAGSLALLAGHERPTLDDALEAAREQTRHRFTGLAERVPPRAGWDDLSLPPAVLAQLRELCARVELETVVLDDWGMGAALRGRGVSALLAGGPGTGKTLAAEVLAGHLGLDLFRVDLAGVVSKYIGETEKNLDRVFAAADGANAIVLFDEAEALFGKRSEVRDSHDRYANLEVAYLLQKMEAFAGVALLATNLRNQLDDAFSRRLDFVIHFPFPEAPQRTRMWDRAWPAGVPVEGVASANLATLPLSGAAIANAARGAAFLAAADGGVVNPNHVRDALQREYQKLGRTLGDDELSAVMAGDPAA